MRETVNKNFDNIRRNLEVERAGGNPHLTSCADIRRLLNDYDQLAKLVSEVMEWHRDKDSPDYNLCDDAPCEWCSKAARLLSPNSITGRNPVSPDPNES